MLRFVRVITISPTHCGSTPEANARIVRLSHDYLRIPPTVDFVGVHYSHRVISPGYRVVCRHWVVCRRVVVRVLPEEPALFPNNLTIVSEWETVTQ